MSSSDFLRHYINYLLQPKIALTLAVLVAPLLFTTVVQKVLAPKEANVVPGCFSLGLIKRTNLDSPDDSSNTAKSKGKPRVKALFVYPLSGCQGVEVRASQVDASGLMYDQKFCLVRRVAAQQQHDDVTELNPLEKENQQGWQAVTQNTAARLSILRTELWIPKPKSPEKSDKGPRQNDDTSSSSKASPDNAPEGGYFNENGGCLVVRFPYEPKFNPFGLLKEIVMFQIPLSPTSHRARVKHYREETILYGPDGFGAAVNMTNEIDPEKIVKLQRFLGISEPLGLFVCGRRFQRLQSNDAPIQSRSVSLINVASLQAVDDAQLTQTLWHTNVFIEGAPASKEKSWKRIALGRRLARTEKGLFETNGEFEVCETTDDQGHLGASRAKVSVEATPMFERGLLKVGDEIRVLETQ